MQFELTRVAPLQAANVMALVYGLVMLAVVLIMLPFLLIFLLIGATAGGEDPAAFLGGAIGFAVVLVAYPVMGLVFGWIGGLLGAWIYNLIAGWIGGIRYTVRDLDAPPAPAPSTSYAG